MTPLPPLNALRAFDASARHLSVTLAASELHVTPAAVSHQLKALEDYLGVRLFVRSHRQLQLTEEGYILAPGLRAGFQQLHAAVQRFNAQQSTHLLTVSATQSFCSKWLIPKLDDFRRRNPKINIRIDACNQLVDFSRDTVDVAIRFGKGRYPGLVCCKLWDTQIFPVCSPTLASKHKPLNEPHDLVNHTLLHSAWLRENEIWCWQTWLLSAALHDIDPIAGPQFNEPELAIQAAINSQGVALAKNILVEDDLAAGRLIRPFKLSLDLNFGYSLIYPGESAALPKVQAFKNWILQTASADGDCLE